MLKRIELTTLALIAVSAATSSHAIALGHMLPGPSAVPLISIASLDSGYIHADLKNFVPTSTVLDAKNEVLPTPWNALASLFLVKVASIGGGSGDVIVDTSGGGSSCISSKFCNKHGGGSGGIMRKTGQFVQGGAYVFGAGSPVSNGKNLLS